MHTHPLLFLEDQEDTAFADHRSMSGWVEQDGSQAQIGIFEEKHMVYRRHLELFVA